MLVALCSLAIFSSAHAGDLRLSAEFTPASEEAGAQLDFQLANHGERELRDFRFLGGAIACAEGTADGAAFNRTEGLLKAGDSVACTLTPRAGSGRLTVAARDSDGGWHKAEHGYRLDTAETTGRGSAPAAQAVILIGAVHDDADFNFDFTPGETVDFSFTVVNTGEAPLDSIVVTDTLGTAITCPPGPLAAGEAQVCTSTYTIQAGDDPVILENEADLAAEDDGGTPVAAQDSIFMIAGFTADARMFKAPLLSGDGNGDGFAGPDDVVTYQFVLKNSSAEDLTVDDLSDPLPGLGVINCPAETLDGNPFTGIPGGELVSGDTVMCSAEYTVTAADRDDGQINNTANAEATSNETFSFVSTGASATVTVPSATVTIEKVSLGDIGTFEFVLDNVEDSPISITTTTPGDPESSDPIQIDNLNDVDLVISEIDPAPDWVLLSAVCSDGTDTWTLEDGSITIPAGTIVPGAEFGCEFVNGTAPDIVTDKDLVAESGDVDEVAEAGEQLTYEITLINTGFAPKPDHPVVDQLDPNVIFISADNGGVHDGSATGGEVNWTVDVPAADDNGPGMLVLTVIVQVVDPIPDGVLEIGNVAYDPDEGPPECDVIDPPPNCSDPLPTEPNVSDSKDLVAESGAVDDVAEAGEQLTYEITLTNSGGTDAENHVQIDQLDPNVVFVSADNGGVHDGSATGGDVTWTVTVPADSVLVLTVIVQVVDPIPDGVLEIGNVTYDPDEGPPECDVIDPPPNCSGPLPTEPNVSDSKDLMAESGDTDGEAEAGEQLTYEITLTNSGGSDAVNHVQIDQLDANVIFVSADNGGVHDGSAAGGDVTWTVTVPANDTLVLMVTVQVVDPIPDGVLEIGNVTYDPDEGPPDCDVPNPPPNCAPPLPTEPQVSDSKDLVAESGDTDGEAEAGEQLTYEITLVNSGGADAENHVQIDQLDANVIFVSADNGGVHDGSATGGDVTWTVTVPANGVLVLTVAVQVVDPIPDGVTEIGNVTYNPDDGPPDCDMDVPPPNCSDPLPTEPNVSDSKDLVAENGELDGVAEAGEQLTYAITLSNTGGLEAVDYPIVDQLDPNVIFVTADNGGVHDGSATGGQVQWSVTVPAGASVVLTVVVEVVTPIPSDVTSIGNVAYNPDVGPPNCDDDPAPPNCTEIPTDPRQPVLNIDKQVAPANYEPGESGTYTLAIVVEEGVALGTGPVDVTDPMPEPLTISGEVTGSDWDCTASTDTQAVCSYTGAYPVAPGDMVGGTISIPFTVPEDTDADGNIVNVATVTYGPDQSTADADASVVIQGEDPPEPIAVPIDARWTLWLLMLMFLSAGLGNLLMTHRRS